MGKRRRRGEEEEKRGGNAGVRDRVMGFGNLGTETTRARHCRARECGGVGWWVGSYHI